jgi:hypothetical protein
VSKQSDISEADGHRIGQELSTAIVLFHEAVGARLGLTAMDHKALDVIIRKGPLTAGALARHTGLSPGAVTALIDRLERQGYAGRMADPADRRRVLVGAAAPPTGVADIFAELAERMRTVMSRYDRRQVAAILDHAAATTAVLTELIERLTQAPPAGDDPMARGTPRSGRRGGLNR